MSFITDIIKFGLGQFGIQATGESPEAIAQSAITGFLANRVNSAIKKSNPANTTAVNPATAATTQEREVTVEFKADTQASIPVVYGEGYVDPLLIDVQLVNNNCTMWYAVALCETTGNDINGNPSTITFEEIYWEGKKLTFGYDGVSVLAAWEGIGRYAKADTSLNGVVKIYCYNGGSESPTNIRPQGLEVLHGNAYDIMPLWTANHLMSNLCFALIRVDYDAEKDIRGINNLKFKMRNSITKPGDVLYDYMNNSVYGAGLDAATISAANLNTYSDTSINYTDNRPADVFFSIPEPENQTTTVTDSSAAIFRPYEILDIVQPATTSVEYSIDVSALTGATITWPTTPSGSTVTESSGTYTIDGIDTVAIWDIVKDPNLNIPDTLQGTYTYTVTISYTNTRGAQTYSYDVEAYIPVAKLNSVFSVSSTATIS